MMEGEVLPLDVDSGSEGCDQGGEVTAVVRRICVVTLLAVVTLVTGCRDGWGGACELSGSWSIDLGSHVGQAWITPAQDHEYRVQMSGKRNRLAVLEPLPERDVFRLLLGSLEYQCTMVQGCAELDCKGPNSASIVFHRAERR